MTRVRKNKSAAAMGIAVLAISIGVAETAPSGPSYHTVVKAQDSVFHVVARHCKIAGKTATLLSSGFAIDVDGEMALITDLHSVASCSPSIDLQYQGSSFSTSVEKVYRKADLVALRLPGGLHISGLPLGAAMPAPGQNLEVIGFGVTPTINPSSATVRLGGGTTISSLIQSADTIKSLKSQGFPDINATIINIDSALTPGDSGAPLINGAGEVVGIANGNLLQGTLPYSWAFPVATVRDLLASTEKMPLISKVGDILIAEEDESGGSASSAGPTKTIVCGVSTFQYRGAQTYAKLLSTADPFAAQHIKIVEANANARHQPIPSSTTFDVYVDSTTGTDFIVPSDYSLTQSGNDCVAMDPNSEVEMRISTAAVPYANTGAATVAFASRTERPNEMPVANAAYITGPVPRGDGMIIQRYALFYGYPGPLTPQNEGYFTFAWRNGTLLEEATRDITPPLTPRTTNIFVSVASVYAATFTMN
jgi:S1-C subfamily serine protease